MKHWSLKTKGLVYIILVALCPLLISGLYNYSSSQREVINMTVDKIKLNQEAKDVMIATGISVLINELNILSRSTVFNEHSAEEIEGYLQNELDLLKSPYFGL